MTSAETIGASSDALVFPLRDGNGQELVAGFG